MLPLPPGRLVAAAGSGIAATVGSAQPGMQQAGESYSYAVTFGVP